MQGTWELTVLSCLFSVNLKLFETIRSIEKKKAVQRAAGSRGPLLLSRAHA